MATRRNTIAGIAVAVSALWMLWSHNSSGPKSAKDPTFQNGPTPSASLRARQQHPTATAPASEEPRPHLPSERVTIRLRRASEGILLLPRRHRLAPREYWPLAGDALFPKGATATQLQSLMQQELEPGATVDTVYTASGFADFDILSWDDVMGQPQTATVSHTYDEYGLASGFVGGQAGHALMTQELVRSSPTRVDASSWTVGFGLNPMRTVEWFRDNGGRLNRKEISGYEPFTYDYDDLQRVVATIGKDETASTPGRAARSHSAKAVRQRNH